MFGFDWPDLLFVGVILLLMALVRGDRGSS